MKHRLSNVNYNKDNCVKIHLYKGPKTKLLNALPSKFYIANSDGI